MTASTARSHVTAACRSGGPRLEPGLAVPGMTAAAEYYDAEVRSARVVLENVFEAIANGAACANYVRVEISERDAARMARRK